MKDEGEREGGEMFQINRASLDVDCSKQVGRQKRNF